MTQTDGDEWDAKARVMFGSVGELWLAENDDADAKGYAYISAALRSAYEKGVEDSAMKCAEIGKDWKRAGDYHSAGAADYLANSHAAIRSLKGE